MLTGRTRTVCQPVCLLLPATSTRWFMEENRADLISACLWAPRRSHRVQQPLGTQGLQMPPKHAQCLLLPSLSCQKDF